MDKQLVLKKVQASCELAIDCESYFGGTAGARKLEEMVSIAAELEEYVVDEHLSESAPDSTAADESSQDIAADFGAAPTTTSTDSNSFELPVDVGAGAYPNVNGSRDSRQQYPPSWTRERVAEWDPDIKSGISGISGMKYRARNGYEDRGEYAGQMHLMSTQGHNPIAVPGGVDVVLRERGIWDKYKNRRKSHDGKILFDKSDQFRARWVRREDGTRIFVSIA